MATAPALEQALLDAAEDRTGTGEVIVDLTGCSFLDSRGLTTLIEAGAPRALEPTAGGRSLNPNVLMVFKITGFDGVFEIYPSLAAAGGDGHG